MAEMEEERVHVHKRNTHLNRSHPGQNRLYMQLGVKDLRELLDKKRNEREYVNECSIPPADPSYNYLKDPLRENDDNTPHDQQTKVNHTKKFYNKNNAGNSFKRDRDNQGGHASNYPKNKDIENPLNIKVEFSTSTGEHVYKMDETTILPTIKHVPDKMPFQNRPFRGRGRGRGRGQQRSYPTRTIRNNADKRTPKNNVFENKLTPVENPSVSCDVENWDDELNIDKNTAKMEDFYQQLDDYIDEEQQLKECVENSLHTGVESLNLNESKAPVEHIAKKECDEEIEDENNDNNAK